MDSTSIGYKSVSKESLLIFCPKHGYHSIALSPAQPATTTRAYLRKILTIVIEITAIKCNLLVVVINTDFQQVNGILIFLGDVFDFNLF